MSEPPSERRPWRTDEEWNRLGERISADPVGGRSLSRALRWPWVSAAVLAAGVVAILVVPRLRRSSRAIGERTLRTAAGERLVVRLSDSTIITLGPETTLRVRTSGAGREAALEGEAQFSVVHDSRRPFVVSAAGARATDVGTRFVVRAYARDSAVRVAVIDGIVSLASIAPASSSSTITLHAGEVGIVTHDGSPHGAPQQVAASYAAWVDGKLSFDDAPLSEVAVELSRWFDVDIRIADSALAGRRVTATYSDARLGDVLEALATTLHAHYTRTGRSIVVAPVAVPPASRP